MSIDDWRKKARVFLSSLAVRDFYIIAIIILVAFGSFGLGRLSKIGDNREPIKVIQQAASAVSAVSNLSNLNVAENFVASKNGTKYHFPWCSGAKQMKEENKIWFATKEEAEAAGYTKAANCKGL